jgi:DNA-binding response OmpR family regulator
LLDYLLPDMNGLECLDQLRVSKGVEQTPVILMSAALPEGVQKRQRIQVHSDFTFLEQPFEMEALLILVRQLIER